MRGRTFTLSGKIKTQCFNRYLTNFETQVIGIYSLLWQDVIKSVMQIRPMWMDCPPCVPGVETSHFIIDLDNADAEVSRFFGEVWIVLTILVY